MAGRASARQRKVGDLQLRSKVAFMTVHGSSDSVAYWTTSKAFHDAGRSHLLDRDHSLVAFNERVFSWAARTDVPVLERLR